MNLRCGPHQSCLVRHVAKINKGRFLVSPAASTTTVNTVPQYTLSSTQPGELGWRTDMTEHYMLGQLVGGGSFGEVHVGIHVKSGLVVAIKTLQKVRGELSREETLSRIVRETRMLSMLQSIENVVRLFDCFEDHDFVHIVTELCQGGDLHRYVETNGVLNEASLALVASKIVRLLKHCHEKGILHGDIKPANFCLKNARAMEPFKDLRAIDFGCSQNLGSKRLTKRTGTRVFMAPEIFGRDYSLKADIWALGVTLYWLYCRSFPFFNSQVIAVASLQQISDAVNMMPISYDYGPWLEMSDQGKDFIQRCLTRSEKDRFSAEEAMMHPWLQNVNYLDEISPWQ